MVFKGFLETVVVFHHLCFFAYLIHHENQWFLNAFWGGVFCQPLSCPVCKTRGFVMLYGYYTFLLLNLG